MIFINFVMTTTKPFATRIAGLVQQGIGKKGAEVQASTFVILIGFGAKSKLTFFKALPSQILEHYLL